MTAKNRVATEAAYRIYKAALKSGDLVRPDKCEECDKACVPDGHHSDYSKPTEVAWLCRDCHQAKHKHRLGKFGASKGHRRASRPLAAKPQQPVRANMSQIARRLNAADSHSPESVGRRLASVRVLRGMTQAEVSKASGVTEATISRAESGTYSADTLVKLNAVLRSSLDYILYGEGAP